jgi:hypothetical protein
MVLLKFIGILVGIYLFFYIFFKLFGKAIQRALVKGLVRRAQKSMDNQSQIYEQQVNGHSPFEDTVYVEDDVKVSIRRGNKPDPNKKPELPKDMIEEVEYEDVE